MAKSMRSKREKRLRAIRREIVEPFYQEKDVAKFAAQEAALAAPKLPVRVPKTTTMDTSAPIITSENASLMDIEMTTEGQAPKSLKPVGAIGKKMKKKFKLAKKKHQGKGKIRRKNI